MMPTLRDAVIARVEDGGVMVDKPGIIVGRTIEGKDRVRFDVLHVQERDNLKRLSINIPAANVRKQ